MIATVAVEFILRTVLKTNYKVVGQVKFSLADAPSGQSSHFCLIFASLLPSAAVVKISGPPPLDIR